MRTQLVDPSDVLSTASTTWKHGLYVVRERDATRAIKKRQLYVVHPIAHRHNDRVVVTADHLSFVHDPNDKTTPLHLHLTEYVPEWSAENGLAETGDRRQINCFMPLRFELSTATRLMSQRVASVPDRRDPLRSILGRSCVPGSLRDPPGSRTRTRRRRTRKQQQTLRLGSTFDDLWKTLPIRKLVVMGVQTAGGSYDFTVRIHDRMRHAEGNLQHARMFSMDGSLDAFDEAKVQDEVVRVMAGMKWSDFVAS